MSIYLPKSILKTLRHRLFGKEPIPDDDLVQSALDEIIAGTNAGQHPKGTTPRSENQLTPHTDRVVQNAIETGLVTREEVASVSSGGERINWRSLAKTLPSRSTEMYRLAASTYGYDSALVCEVSTLVQADALARTIPGTAWNECFELGIVPVVPHGERPSLDSGVVLASHDPSQRKIRSYTQEGPFGPCKSVYVDDNDVRSLQELLIRKVPAIGNCMNNNAVNKQDNTTLRIVKPETSSELRRAA